MSNLQDAGVISPHPTTYVCVHHLKPVRILSDKPYPDIGFDKGVVEEQGLEAEDEFSEDSYD